jgi:hypothetical protein
MGFVVMLILVVYSSSLAGVRNEIDDRGQDRRRDCVDGGCGCREYHVRSLPRARFE